MRNGFAGLAVLVTLIAAAGSVLAAAPQPWQIGFQPAATPVMAEINAFHNMLLYIIFAIAAFVMLLLLYVMFRFNAKANPVASKTSHNTLIEVLWTIVPVIILIVIAVPSFKLLYFMDRTTEAEMTVKAVGHQWYWSYVYPDQGDMEFDSTMVEDDEIKPGQIRLLSVDNPVVVPVDTTVRLLTTAESVIHSWAMPAFGVKLDAVPGRINETWFRVDKEGTYYGQCSELCGIRHAFMPIAVKVVSKTDYQKWLVEARKAFARNDPPAALAVAAAQSTP